LVKSKLNISKLFSRCDWFHLEESKAKTLRASNFGYSWTHTVDRFCCNLL
jgi:hypothetical protein